MSSYTLVKALELAALGLPVFPCRNHPNKALDKRPQVMWKAEASTDPKLIRSMWPPSIQDEWTLVGVRTGAVSGIVAIDIDPRHGGHLWKDLPRLPATRVHSTKSGGWHFLFRHPDMYVSGLLDMYAPGVDVRGDGNYIIWWPAHGYPLANALPMDQLADWPLSWLQIATRPHPDSEIRKIRNHMGVRFFDSRTPMRSPQRQRGLAKSALERAVENMASSPHGVHNGTLYKEVCALEYHILIGELSIDEVAKAMTYAARKVGHADYRIRTTLASAFNTIMRKG